jgi:regulator of cell morphogenesis and NO signaling
MDHILFKEQVLQRYKMVNYLPPSTVSKTAASDLNHEFINVLIRAFEEEQNFSYREFRSYPISILIDYIRRTHRLYLDKSLQEIEQSIFLLSTAYRRSHPLLAVLNSFYLDYKTDLVGHIKEEDERLLPYIEFLADCMNSGFDQFSFYKRSQDFSISEFLEHHEDNDSVLQEVRHKILTYDPPQSNRSLYRILLNQLDFLAHDLKIHGLIEDYVLLPCAIEMEQKLNREFRGIILNN